MYKKLEFAVVAESPYLVDDEEKVVLHYFSYANKKLGTLKKPRRNVVTDDLTLYCIQKVNLRQIDADGDFQVVGYSEVVEHFNYLKEKNIN